MTHINLRPWREERRQLHQKEFYLLLGLTFFLAVIVVLVFSSIRQQQINYQSIYNNGLTQEIAALDEKIQEVKFLQKKRILLIERMDVIQNLQANRSFVVRVFDDLVRTLPAGVFYEKLQRKENIILAKGIAKTNEDVAELLRKLETSACFKGALLANVRSSSDVKKSNQSNVTVTPGLNYFELTIHEKLPSSDKNEPLIQQSLKNRTIHHAKL